MTEEFTKDKLEPLQQPRFRVIAVADHGVHALLWNSEDPACVSVDPVVQTLHGKLIPWPNAENLLELGHCLHRG